MLERFARDKHSSLLLTCLNYDRKMFYAIALLGLIKLFWRKFIHTFCKLDHFIKNCKICNIMKRHTLQKRVSKFVPIKFYEIDSGANVIKLFTTVIYDFL